MSAADVSVTFEPIANVADVPVGAMRGITLRDGTKLCVVHTAAAGVCAVLDKCPHRDFPLTNGELTTDGLIECAWHGAQFDPVSGAELVGPGCDALTRYTVRLVADIIEVGPRMPS
jgi:nitrite reductase/ring-hydroxylating ferredoxin subunit